MPHHRCRRSRYLPYGQERWITGTLTTDFTFTGQRADNYTHLIEMGARWHDKNRPAYSTGRLYHLFVMYAITRRPAPR